MVRSMEAVSVARQVIEPELSPEDVVIDEQVETEIVPIHGDFCFVRMVLRTGIIEALDAMGLQQRMGYEVDLVLKPVAPEVFEIIEVVDIVFPSSLDALIENIRKTHQFPLRVVGNA